MEFHQYPTTTQIINKAGGRPTSGDELFLFTLLTQGPGQGAGQLEIENTWAEDKRPYYCVWPAITEAILKVRLDVPSNSFELPLRVLAIRFAVGQEPEVAGRKLRSILAGRCLCKPIGEPGISVYVDQDETLERDGVSVPIHTWHTFKQQEKTVEELVTTAPFDPDITQADREVLTAALRVVVGVSLMADDPDIVVPDVLSKDRAKLTEATAERLHDKAKRRGKYGWMVGQKMSEMSPHVRRPHFAIRWMGHGADKVPKLRPIKGSIVKRHKITDLPTGYDESE